MEDSKHSSFNLTPHILTALQGNDKAPIVIYLHPTGLGIMNPMLMEEDQLKRVFTKGKKWNFLSYEGAKVCNLLRFKTMRSDKVFIGLRGRKFVAG